LDFISLREEGKEFEGKSLKIVVDFLNRDFLNRSAWTGEHCEEILLWDFFALLCVDSPDGKFGAGAATTCTTTTGQRCGQLDSLL
jgi:hypothetical protein